MVAGVPQDATDDVPTAIAALAATARKGETTFLRCMDQDCRLRPHDELDVLLSSSGGLESLLPDCEMDRDDMEGGAADVDALEAKDDDQDQDDEPMPPPLPSPRGSSWWTCGLSPMAVSITSTS